MDPVANRNQQRELAAQIIALTDRTDEDDDLRGGERDEAIANLAVTLAELVLALDEWRLRGGFDPYRTA